MGELALVKSAAFGEIPCDFYSGKNDLWMTREQIGTALEYADPRKAIFNIHARKKDRLDRFSTVLKTREVDGKEREIVLYNCKGVMEICRHSDQPKADAFMDFCWEIMDGLLREGIKTVGMTDYQKMTAHTRAENARIRKARILERIAGCYEGTYRQVLQAYATKELTGEFLLPLPELGRKTYSAHEIGQELGISAHKVGLLANANGLKTEAYGKWFVDKSPHSSKEVQSFRYYDTVIPVLRELL